jgi:hypothetical protein
MAAIPSFQARYGDAFALSISQQLQGRHYAVMYAHSGLSQQRGVDAGCGRDLWAWDPAADRWAFVRTLGAAPQSRVGQRLGTPVVVAGRLVLSQLVSVAHDALGREQPPDSALYVWPGVQFCAAQWAYAAPALNSLASLSSRSLSRAS